MNFRELMLYQFREEKRIENRVEEEEDEACVWFIECDIAQKYEQPLEKRSLLKSALVYFFLTKNKKVLSVNLLYTSHT